MQTDLIKLKVPFYKNNIPKKDGIKSIAPVLIESERLKKNEDQ